MVSPHQSQLLNFHQYEHMLSKNLVSSRPGLYFLHEYVLDELIKHVKVNKSYCLLFWCLNIMEVKDINMRTYILLCGSEFN